jgi:hypothetical protein
MLAEGEAANTAWNILYEKNLKEHYQELIREVEDAY